MNNVKTNRTFEQECKSRCWVTEEYNAYREEGWNAALESVIQEPALTWKEALYAFTSAADWEFGEWAWKAIERGLDNLLNKLAAGHIPAPATADKIQSLENGGISWEIETPQEGELTQLIDKLLSQQSTTGASGERLDFFDVPLIRRFVDDVKAAHNQALSAREQAVKGEYQEAFDFEHEGRVRWLAETERLRAELAAEKLANEGKYAIGERVEYQLGTTWNPGVVVVYSPKTVAVHETLPTRRLTPTLTPDQKAEAFVDWKIDSSLDVDAIDAWKELATRQANGETIDRIYAEVKP